MVTKKTNGPTVKKAAPVAVKTVKKAAPATVVARTTKPKVVIQTKKLSDQLPPVYVPTNETCGHKHHKGK
ncbi:MAG: hypothetical protein LBG59_05500 [Candidatus Peribacteria bacterium]|jgi:hypothetical protein|nr:hypothetical protein [Candidatus Peribacteria bacterium]